jgi:hypothetical protein
MIDKHIKNEFINLWLFDYDNEEWERVRSICLEENNRLRDNYLPHRCKITDHRVFFVAYLHDGRPAMFGGIKEYSPNVARMFNRMFGFPSIRSVVDFKFNHMLLGKYIMPEMEKAIGHQYDLTFISMQQRERGYPGKQAWWNYWKDSWFEITEGWKEHPDLVQTYSSEEKTCYQNIVYRELNNFKFSDWNPKTLSHNEYYERFIKLS